MINDNLVKLRSNYHMFNFKSFLMNYKICFTKCCTAETNNNIPGIYANYPIIGG